MSREDFARSTPEEFAAICSAWDSERQSRSRDSWERMRLLATITVQPHVKGKVRPKRLLTFPWDSKQPGRKGERPMSREEQRARFEKLSKLLSEKDGEQQHNIDNVQA